MPVVRRVLAPRLRVLAVLLALLGSSAWAAHAPAPIALAAESKTFSVHGAGYGHGYGMSQYGAYGAALKGLNWQEILDFYYPGTKLDTMATGTRILVWVTVDNDSSLRVRPTAGLKVRDRTDKTYVVPTGSKYTGWRISRSGSGNKLSYRNPSGDWVTKATGLDSSTWSFSSSDSLVTLVLPNGSTRVYRGSLRFVKHGNGGRTVNNVKLEDYVRGVVPSEMPTSWAADAVRAQAVAARSYAVRLRDFANYDGYDICDTTACQVYAGAGRETSLGDSAVKATSHTIVSYKGAVALTMFASSNGGHTAQGSYPYLSAHSDRYDGVVTSQAWTKKISASGVAHAWPSVGTVKRLQVTKRDGEGAWGGRVLSIKIIGSRSSVTVSGSTFQHKFGMRSTLFTV